MIENVLSHLAKYHQTASHKGKVGLRISRLLLLDREFPQFLESLVEKYQVDPSELELEVNQNPGNSRFRGNLIFRQTSSNFSQISILYNPESTDTLPSLPHMPVSAFCIHPQFPYCFWFSAGALPIHH